MPTKGSSPNEQQAAVPAEQGKQHRRYYMKIEKSAMAGTLESSDAQVTIEPASGLELNIQSSVLNQ